MVQGLVSSPMPETYVRICGVAADGAGVAGDGAGVEILPANAVPCKRKMTPSASMNRGEVFIIGSSQRLSPSAQTFRFEYVCFWKPSKFCAESDKLRHSVRGCLI